MKITRTAFQGLLIIEAKMFNDERGFFTETFQKNRFDEEEMSVDFVQDNHSWSKKNVLRGMHFRVKKPQAQLVTVISGKVFDVCVDLRVGSPTFKNWLELISNIYVRESISIATSCAILYGASKF